MTKKERETTYFKRTIVDAMILATLHITSSDPIYKKIIIF
jgi:hypothetical protein